MSRSRSWNWLTGLPSELPVGFTDVNTYNGIFSQTDPASDLRSYSVTLVQVNWRVWFQLLEPLALNLQTNYAMCEDPCLWHRSYSVTLRLSYLTCMISGSGTWILIVHWHTGGPQATHNNRCKVSRLLPHNSLTHFFNFQLLQLGGGFYATNCKI